MGVIHRPRVCDLLAHTEVRKVTALSEWHPEHEVILILGAKDDETRLAKHNIQLAEQIAAEETAYRIPVRIWTHVERLNHSKPHGTWTLRDLAGLR